MSDKKLSPEQPMVFCLGAAVRAVLCVVLLAAAAATVSAQTAADFSVELTADGAGVRIRGYTGSATRVTIPATIEGLPVREIKTFAFSEQEISSVTFPAGLTTIGAYAFSRSKLTSVVLPDSVTEIGEQAFSSLYWCTSVTLPRNLTKLGEAAFADCYDLSSIKFTGTALTEIPAMAFQNAAVKTIVIPEGIKKLGGAAFGGMAITSVTLPSTLTAIGSGAFGSTQLKTIVIPDSVTTIGTSAFEGCGELRSVTLGAGIRNIERLAFANCASLTTLVIPDSVAEINFGYKAFDGCGKLTLASQAALKKWGYTGGF
jgi:hypothetical protein